jgi:hypothetical protein
MLAHGFKIELCRTGAGRACDGDRADARQRATDGDHSPADHGRRPAGAGAGSMALILKRASAHAHPTSGTMTITTSSPTASWLAAS